MTIAGRAGLEIEFRPSTILGQECDQGLLLSSVGTDQAPRFAELPVDGRTVRLAAIDVSGALVVVVTEGGWKNKFDDVVRDGDTLVGSIVFD